MPEIGELVRRAVLETKELDRDPERNRPAQVLTWRQDIASLVMDEPSSSI